MIAPAATAKPSRTATSLASRSMSMSEPPVWSGQSWNSPVRRLARRTDLVEHRSETGAEGLGILAHRKVPEPLHDRHLRAADACRRRLRLLPSGVVVVFAGDNVARA